MAINTDAVQRLYVAYFNRPADPAGLAFWESQLPSTTVATQAQLATIASGFSGSQEYTALYATQTTAQIVNNLYNNLFGRAVEAAGLVHWAGRLQTGSETFASIALQLTYSAQGTDATAIANKLTAANAFTTALDTAAEINGYSGLAAAASARSWLETVADSAASLTTATEASVLAAAVTAATNAGTATTGSTFTLTADAPSITEGDSGTKALTFTLTLDHAPTETVTINYQTLTTGTATIDDDFVTAAGTVTFAAGQQIATVSITVNGDIAFEVNETVAVKFFGTSLAADVTATGTILNNDLVQATPTSFTLTMGAAGANVITGSAGAAATITLMTGVLAAPDIIVFTSTAGANASGTTFGQADVITNFTVGVDKLQFSTADVVSAQQAAVQTAVTALTAGSTATQIATVMATANTTALGVSFAVFEGNTYMLYETAAASTGVAADDVFIKLTGVTTLPTFAVDIIA